MDHTTFELYVHIPFCVRKCRYCDFLSGPASEQVMKEYTDALIREIRQVPEATDRFVSTIFIGGGTPSLLPVGDMERLFACLREKFRILPEAEISMEANPGTLSMDSLRIYRALGINRLSMGLQSADDEELRFLGRIHTFADFAENYAQARKAGFDNINIDLMMALPGSTRSSLRRTMEQAVSFDPEHISAYSLIVEEGTPFAQMDLELPDEDTEYAMYEDTGEYLAAQGYVQYEISNYAKSGCECRHNCGYWERTDYLGLGLGASSLWGDRRFSNTDHFRKYLEESLDPRKIRMEEEVLTEEDAMAEHMFLGLRMNRGISEEEFRQRFGISLMEQYGDVICKYLNLGMLIRGQGRIRLSRAGIHVSNRIMAEFLPE